MEDFPRTEDGNIVPGTYKLSDGSEVTFVPADEWEAQDEPEFDSDEAYERFLETQWDEEIRDLYDEAMDEGLQELRNGR